MIVYLVAPTLADGVAEAQRRGWHRGAAFRFYTPARHDVRVVVRPDEINPLPGVTLLMRTGWDEGPPQADSVACRAWPARQQGFEDFVASGHARWVEDPDTVPDTGGPTATPPTRSQAF